MGEFLRSDIFLYIILAVNCLLLILYVVTTIKTSKTKKEYKKFMKKLGNGTDIEEILKDQVEKMDKLNLKLTEVSTYCKRLDEEKKDCVQKVGIIRYSAFRDVGSDLSFALALLDESNSGVVLNGIYSSEASNIYAKPIIKGESKYKITEEEQKAIDIALKSEIKISE